MSRLVAAALVLLMTVGGLLGAAAWNRTGEAQSIVLTERELRLPWWWPSDSRSPRLGIQWQPRSEPQDARLWLSESTLAALGFTLGVPAGAPEAADVYGRSLPRLAWVAFEVDGPAWRTIEQRRTMKADGFAAGWRSESRLVPIDAAPDPRTLVRRYTGQRVVALPAVVRMRYATTDKTGPAVWAEVTSLVSADVSVPAHLRRRLPPDAPARDDRAPRYEVTLRVGRLGALWVEDIRPLSQ
jgi:hypothetical protein